MGTLNIGTLLEDDLVMVTISPGAGGDSSTQLFLGLGRLFSPCQYITTVQPTAKVFMHC
jgi:hypothetical protein